MAGLTKPNVLVRVRSLWRGKKTWLIMSIATSHWKHSTNEVFEASVSYEGLKKWSLCQSSSKHFMKNDFKTSSRIFSKVQIELDDFIKTWTKKIKALLRIFRAFSTCIDKQCHKAHTSCLSGKVAAVVVAKRLKWFWNLDSIITRTSFVGVNKTIW